jgi:hypothetical protein
LEPQSPALELKSREEMTTTTPPTRGPQVIRQEALVPQTRQEALVPQDQQEALVPQTRQEALVPQDQQEALSPREVPVRQDQREVLRQAAPLLAETDP